MTWEGSLRQQVLQEFVDAARLRGAKSPDDEAESGLPERTDAVKRMVEPAGRNVVRRRKEAA